MLSLISKFVLMCKLLVKKWKKLLEKTTTDYCLLPTRLLTESHNYFIFTVFFILFPHLLANFAPKIY